MGTKQIKNKDENKTNKNKEEEEITILTLLRYYNLSIKIHKNKYVK